MSDTLQKVRAETVGDAFSLAFGFSDGDAVIMIPVGSTKQQAARFIRSLADVIEANKEQ